MQCAKSSAESEAPPINAPSMSGWFISSGAVPGFTEPPYWMRTDYAAAAPNVSSTV